MLGNMCKFLNGLPRNAVDVMLERESRSRTWLCRAAGTRSMMHPINPPLWQHHKKAGYNDTLIRRNRWHLPLKS